MLFLTLSNFVLFSIQWVCETLRCQCYTRIMHRLLRRASILIHPASKIHRSDLTRTSLLNVASEVSETVQFEDDYLKISSLEPKQEIDLSSWTSYTSYLGNHSAFLEKPDQDICVLLEARRPRDLNQFVNRAMGIPPAYRVHVLSHGFPIAWKTAQPFGIILHCSLADLVILSDAFGQGRLTLDEDLELIGLITVQTKGCPQSLVQSDKLSAEEDLDIHDSSEDKMSAELKSSSRATKVSQLESPRQGEATANLSSPRIVSSSGSFDHNELSTHKGLKSPDYDHEDLNQSVTYVSAQDPNPNSSTLGIQNGPEKVSSNTGKESISKKTFAKPPNILVYSGVKDTVRKFDVVKSSLQHCINTDAYTIYHLSHDMVLSSPWRSNAALLVISSCPQLRQEVEDEFVKYILQDNGRLLSFNSSVDSVFIQRLKEKGIEGDRLVTFKFKGHQLITSVQSQFYYSCTNGNFEIIIPKEFDEIQSVQERDVSDLHQTRNNTDNRNLKAVNAAMIVKIHCGGGGMAILSQLLLERDPTEFARDQYSFAALKRSNTDRLAVLCDLLTSLGIDTSSGTALPLTPCLLLARRVGLKETFLDSFKHRLKENNTLKSQKMILKFLESLNETMATPSILPVLTNVSSDVRTDYFDIANYWKNLKTSKLGQVVFYTDVITTTMTVFDGLLFSIPEHMGPIAIAGRQTSGRGRGGNTWLSPVGCAMFTLPLSLNTDSELGQRVSFLQHIVSLAVVQSIVTLPGYEELNIRLKWPNDIYYGKEMKLGGVLVTSTVMGSHIFATVGCGFNVCNSNPTICVNDIIQLYNTSHSELPDLSPLSPGQLLGQTVTILESLLEDFEKNGHLPFTEKYYRHWLHGNAKVKIQLDQTSEGVVVGLDDYGFLSIRKPDGELISVQPDGNSFDMMHNLIHVKPRS